MVQQKIGRFIALLRKEKNMTQEELAEKLGVTNKAISKWETGKCLPDSSLYSPLCNELGITINELLNGERINEENLTIKSEENIVKIMETVEELKSERKMLWCILIIIFGIATGGFNKYVGPGPVSQFLSGVSQGLSIGITFIGIILFLKWMVEKEKKQ